MKTKSARLLVVAAILYFLFVLISFSSYAQASVNVTLKKPEAVFTNAALISGTDRQPGARYRFSSVKTGIDAIVTINSISPGISISTFDESGSGGFDQAFQPRIAANAKTNGYAEFNIAYVVTLTNTPATMTSMPATSIDVDGVIDGRDSLLEFDEFITPGAHTVDFDMAATDLSIYMSNRSVRGRNKKGVDRPAIDTLYKQAMFGVNYFNITNFTVRIGIDNQMSYSVNRQRSIYFQNFFFNNSFLPVNNVTSFKGVLQDNTARLSWSMPKQHDVILVTVERSTNGVNFSPVGDVLMTDQDDASFSNSLAQAGNYFYRLKLTDPVGKVSYTNILVIKNGGSDKQAFKVFPSVINTYTTVNFTSAKKETAQLMLVDNMGRMVVKQPFDVQTGVNTAMLNGLEKLPAGQYIALLKGSDFSYNQKVIISR